MRPAFDISVNGTNITRLVADRLLSLTVVDEAGVKSDRVEITLDDRDERLAIPPTKAEMTVAIGYADTLVDKGRYTVEEIELEGPDRRMTIRANAVGASKGAGAARERSWHDTTLGEIARSIGGKRGWQVSISEELARIKIDHIDQTENDLQFLSKIAADNGAVAKVTHGHLVIAPHASGKSASGKELPVVAIHAGETTEWALTIVERGGYEGVKANYYDMKTAERGDAVAGADGENTHTLPHTYPDKESAERAAKSKRETLERGKTRFSIRSMPGNPYLASETDLDATGFRAGVDGRWTVIRVSHQITGESYTCSVDAETPTGGKDKGGGSGGQRFTTDQWGNRVLS